jgi:IclR family transcriptional regulator, KDG regulon repressor
VLEHHRYVECDALSGRYRLGLKLAKLGNIALSRFDLQRVARPFVERLMQETGGTTHLGIVQQKEVMSLVRDHTGKVIAGLSIIGPRFRITP